MGDPATQKRGLFKRKKKKGGNDDTSIDSSVVSDDVSTSSSVRKKRFGRVKRFFKGRSKTSSSSVASESTKKRRFSRKKKNKAAADGTANGANGKPSPQGAKEQYPSNEMKRRDMLKIPEEVLEDLQEVDEEEEEIYNNGVAAAAAAKRKPKKKATGSGNALLHIVLLLIDPKTRRFELLQLEYDSDKAKVSDTLAQIPKSVTEKSIQITNYHGVVDASGKVFDAKTRLATIVETGIKTILVGVPQNVHGTDAVRLARPIINDSKVCNMLTANNIEIEGWVAGRTKRSSKTSRDLSIEVTDGDHSDATLENDNTTAPVTKKMPPSNLQKIMLAVFTALLVSATIYFVLYRDSIIPQQYHTVIDGVSNAISSRWAAVAGSISYVRSKIPTPPPLYKFVPSMALKKPIE